MDPRAPRLSRSRFSDYDGPMAEQAPHSTAHEEVLTTADVARVAQLARLEVPADQLQHYQRHLAAVLGYMNTLRSLELSGVEPMSHPGELVNRLQADEPGPALSTATLMAMAPESMEPFVRVPKVFGESSS